MLKLKLQYFDHLIWRADSLEKTLMLGKIEVKKRRGWQKMKLLNPSSPQWTWVWANLGRWWRTGKPGALPPTGPRRVAHGGVAGQEQEECCHSSEEGIAWQVQCHSIPQHGMMWSLLFSLISHLFPVFHTYWLLPIFQIISSWWDKYSESV